MTTVACERMNDIHTNQQVFVYGGISIFLHAMVLGLLSLFHQVQPMDKPVPLVKVTLVETNASNSSNTTGNPAPPLMNSVRKSQTQQPAPRRSPKPTIESIPSLGKAAMRPIPQPQTAKLPPVQRRVLQDTRATDALTMKNLLKVTRSAAPSTSGVKRTGSSIPMPDLQSGNQTVPPIRTHTPSSATHQDASSPTPVRQALKSAPPGTGKASGTKVGLGRTLPPVYPRLAREQGWEGTVRLRIVVLPDGSPGDITIRKSSGHSILDEAAIEAVKSWKFLPARDGNIPIKSLVEIPINFDLRTQG